MRERAYEIDILKGIGILLVILGHCVPDFPVDLRADALSANMQKFIYTFHMPLFFFCSGFVLGIAPPRSISTVLKNRFIRMLVPYLTFSFASLALRVAFSSFTRSDFSISEGLVGIFLYGKFFWFVYVLFMVLVLMAFFRESKIGLIALVIGGIYLYSQNIELLKLSQMGYFLLFVVIGFLLSPYRSKLMIIMHNIWIPVCLSILLILMFFITPPNCFIIKYLHRISMAWAGIFALYGIVLYPIRNQIINDLINHFGNYSLQYYLIHMIISLPCYYIIAVLHVPASIFAVLLNFIIITIVSFLILKIMLKIRWIHPFVGLK